MNNIEYKKKHFSIPKQLLKQMDKEAKRKNMCRSEFIRYLFHYYKEQGDENE